METFPHLEVFFYCLFNPLFIKRKKKNIFIPAARTIQVGHKRFTANEKRLIFKDISI